MARRPVSQRLERGQDVRPVERADVLRLDRREATDRPREMHEVRLERGPQRVHPRLLGQEVALACVAAGAGGEHVRPGVGAAARQRDEVVPREALPKPQLRLRAAAKLAAVVVAGEQERVGDLTAEAAGDGGGTY